MLSPHVQQVPHAGPSPYAPAPHVDVLGRPTAVDDVDDWAPRCGGSGQVRVDEDVLVCHGCPDCSRRRST